MHILVSTLLRRMALGLSCVAAALCCSAGILLTWLNTDSGRHALLRAAETALAPLSLGMEIKDIALTPGRVRLRGIRLTDRYGQWLVIDEAAMTPRLTALLTGTLAVDNLQIIGPILYRLPVLPPSPETDAIPLAFTGFSGLPVRATLHTLTLENGRIHTAVLTSPPDGSTLEENPPLIAITARGMADAPTHAPLTVDLSLEADLRQPLPTVATARLVTTFRLRAGNTLNATATGILTVTTGETSLPLDYALEADLTGTTATLRTGRVQASGLALEASGVYDAATFTSTGKARVTATAGGHWSALLRRLTGAALDGGIILDANLSGGKDSPLDATLNLTGTNLTWPSPNLNRLLGPNLAFRATAAGTPTALTATVEQFEAGKLSASARATLNSGSAQPLTLAAEAVLGDIALLLPCVSGPLRVTAALSGTTAKAAFTLAAMGNNLRVPAGMIRAARARVSGNATLGEDGKAALAGAATLDLSDGPAGHAVLTTAWGLDRDPLSGLATRVRDLSLTLAGIRCQADISLTLPPAADPVLTGSASARVEDWHSLAALTGLPLAGEQTSIDLRFSHEASKQGATVALRAKTLAMTRVFSLSDLTLDAAFANSGAQDFTLKARSGAGRAGLLDWRSAAITASARNGTGAFALALRNDAASTAALKTLASPGKAVPPAKAERLAAAGTFAIPEASLTLTRLGARLPGSSLGAYLTAPATISIGDGTAVSGVSLAVTPGAGTLTLDASLNPAEAALDAVFSRFPLRMIRDLTGAPLPDATLNATARLRKKGTAVNGTLNAAASLPSLTGNGAAPMTATLTASLNNKADPRFPNLGPVRNGARLTAALFLDAATSVENPSQPPERVPVLLASLPLRFTPSGLPAPDAAAPLSARLSWQGEAAALWNLLPLPDQRLTGIVRVNGEVNGTLAAPRHTLAAYLAGGQYSNAIAGLLLENIAVQAESAAKGVRILAEAGDGKGGTIALEGNLLSNAAGQAMPRLAARVRVNHLAPLHRDDLSLMLSGALECDGPLTRPAVRANLTVERGELSLLSPLGGGVRTLPVASSDASPAAPAGNTPEDAPLLNARITVPGRFFIRGRGLDSEWAGELAVTGTASSPVLTGNLRPVRGFFTLLSKPFAFTGGEILFFGSDRIDPGLDLTLTYDGPTITAIAHAGGTALKPALIMESRPPLPQDQIIAAVLFGKNSTELSRFEALQVAAGLRDLANIDTSGLNPLAAMRTRLGIDMLRLGSSGGSASERRSISGAPGSVNLTGNAPRSHAASDEGATPTLETGKYINDAIYMGLEQGTSTDSTSVRVEVELAPNLSLQGKTSTRSSEVGLGWKKDY